MARIPRLAPGPAAPQAVRPVYVEGPVGPRGLPGPKGDKGDPGPQGPKGDPAVPPSPQDIARHVRIPFDDTVPLPASGDGHSGTSRAVARADHVHPAQVVSIGEGDVGETELADGAVTEAKIGNGAVTEDKLGDGSVTAAKIAAGAVGSDEIAGGAVDTAELADEAVTDAKVDADAAIASSKLAFLQAGTSPVSRTIQSRLRESISLVDFGADTTGATAVDTALTNALAEAANGKVLFVPAGTYSIGSHLQFSSLDDIDIVCAPGVVFDDGGRILAGAVGAAAPNRRVPWGIEFYQCSNLRIWGGTFQTSGTSISGSSTGFWDETNYTSRMPVLGFNDCVNVQLRGVKNSGDPGVGIIVADRDGIVTALTLTPTPAEYGYFALRGAFLNFYQCDQVLVEDHELVADTCAREQLTFLDCTNVSVIRPTSISSGTNFASMGKVILCDRVLITGVRCTDTSTGSLWDLIGDNIRFVDNHVDYPNGKLCDVSHEWNAANGPSDGILIADCSTTGDGPTNVSGSSTSLQITDNDIANVVVRNIRPNVGRSDWSTDPIFVRFPTVASYEIYDCTVVNGALGYTHSQEGGNRIRVHNSKFSWNVASASLDSNGRTFTTRVRMEFFSCLFDADSSGSGVTTINLAGTASASMRFTNCVFRDTSLTITDIDVEFVNCEWLEGSSVTVSSGSASYYGRDFNQRFRTRGALNLGATSSLTIASGAVTMDGSSSNLLILPEGGVADDLTTINGGVVGDIIAIQASGATVTVKDATGNINLNGDFAMDSIRDTLMLIYRAAPISGWVELCRSNNA